MNKRWVSLIEVFAVSLKLGFTSFGGPIAHLGYFYDEYSRRRKWLDERTYTDLVALSQFLPGPASSQVGMGIGVIRAGLLGGLVSWIGFTLPSFVILVLFAKIFHTWNLQEAGWIHGLKVVAVAIVAQAVWGLGKKLASDQKRATIAFLATLFTLLWQHPWSQVVIILLAGIWGMFFLKQPTTSNPSTQTNLHIPIRRTTSISFLIAFLLLLFLLPLIRYLNPHMWTIMIDLFYRVGSFVFGGGHVVLPLLENEITSLGWINPQDFLAGYGAAQAIPGPMFTFASYLGALTGGWTGALVATISIFLPGFLLLMGVLPFWNSWRKHPKFQGALHGVNAAVVGILLAALYDPLFTQTIHTPMDFSLALFLFGLHSIWKLPAWTIVLIGALGSSLLG
ncbi:chromate transporter [Hazenella coriacea]|uniref:Chromate transporter n=1 Tax=Hazenella coriacea TaxID=1179467 RepID=A0A4R3LC57_9BACL|nr:chromate transporter [Hazenella coriacea]